LDYLDGATIASLMTRGWGVEPNFLDRKTQEGVDKELDALYYENNFEEAAQQEISLMRRVRVAWMDISELDRLKQPCLRELFEKIISLPFELNKKCGNDMLLQASGLFEVAVYAAGEGFYSPHLDGAYPKEGEEDSNNGRKVTFIYLPAQGWKSKDGGMVRVYKRIPAGETISLKELGDPVHEMKPSSGSLLCCFSRDVPLEILQTHRRMFVITLWSAGPAVRPFKTTVTEAKPGQAVASTADEDDEKADAAPK
jgi:hypothetical protein